MSAPSTPSSEMPSVKDSRFKPMSTPCERPDSYRPGGFHPVHLGDVLNKRYTVLRKLGYGSFAIVWLAQDSASSAYVALKIYASQVDFSRENSILRRLTTSSIMDPDSEFTLLASDSFVLEGPNGKHHCLVTEPMGPSISATLRAPHEIYDPLNPPAHRFSVRQSKRFLRNILCGLKFLHSNHVVHSDLQLGNVLFSVKDLDTLEISELRQDVTNSKIDPVVRTDGKVDRWAPKYLIQAEPLGKNTLPLDKQVVKLIDFGGAFFSIRPPTSVTTPRSHRAPEIILCHTIGTTIDIWSFGCLMFEIITGYTLFELFTFRRNRDIIDDEHLLQISESVGPLPQYLVAKWQRHELYFDTDGNRLNTTPKDYAGPKSGQVISSKPDSSGPPPPYPSPRDRLYECKPQDMSDEEGEDIASILRDVLQIDPSKRPSAAQLLKYPWFQVS